MYVDFDTIVDGVAGGTITPGALGVPPADEIYTYSAGQRAGIIDYLDTRYAAHDILFFDGLPAIPGTASVIKLNDGSGAFSDGVDFRNLDDDDSAKINTIGTFKFVGKTSGEWTDEDVAIATANLVAHESEHLMGVRHQDAFGPIGTGIGTFPSDYSPAYPLPPSAPETGFSTQFLSTGFGLSFEALTVPRFVSERAAVKFELAKPFVDFVTPEVTDGSNHFFDMAQVIVPTPFSAPYPFREIPDISMLPPEELPFPIPVSIDGFAAVVTGSLSDTSDEGKQLADHYSFTAEAGSFMTIEVMSAILEGGDRYLDPADVAIILLDGTTGTILEYFPGTSANAVNDDDLATSEKGSSLIDAVLPVVADTSFETGLGTYVIEIVAADSTVFPWVSPGAGKDGKDGGSYELFLYTATTSVIFVPEPSTFALLMSLSLVALRRRDFF